jgi:hypothetical protein
VAKENALSSDGSQLPFEGPIEIVVPPPVANEANVLVREIMPDVMVGIFESGK